MEPRIAVMSYDRLTKEIHSTIDKDDLKKLLIINSSFDETREIALKLWNEGKVDVFVSGSSNLEIIKEKIPAPIVSIQISGFDILDNLIKAKDFGDTVAIITYKRPIANFGLYSSILNINVIEKCFNNYNELLEILHELKNTGVKTVIGSSLVCDAAAEINLNSIFIYSANAIKSAIAQAIQIQQSIEYEKYKSGQLNAILSYAYSGIMATDEKNVVQVYNPMAEKILKIPKDKVKG